MADNIENPTLGEATSSYLANLSTEKRAASRHQISKFTHWAGPEKKLSKLKPSEVETYAEQLSTSDTDYKKKFEIVKAFLVYAKKKEWTTINLSVHLKAKVLKKGRTIARTSAKRNVPEGTPLTQQGYDELKTEHAALTEESHQLIGEIRRAAADKDFRENAPLHAARERRGHIEGRIRELENTLKSAVIIEDTQGTSQKIGMGDRVVICEADSDIELCYTIVPPRQADAIKGKMSSASPIGIAIIGREEGETVIIEAPVGRLSYRIMRVER